MITIDDPLVQRKMQHLIDGSIDAALFGSKTIKDGRIFWQDSENIARFVWSFFSVFWCINT